MELSQYFAAWHSILVHFPIALLCTAVGFDIYGFVRQNERALWAGNTFLILGTVGVLFTFMTGSFAEIWAAREMTPQGPLKRHENFATIASWSFIALVAMRSSLATSQPKMFKIYLVAAVAGLFALYQTGAQGARLMSQYAGESKNILLPVRAKGLELANLTLENSAGELAYSVVMHQLFGWLVLGLALGYTYQAFELPGWERASAVGPIIFSAGGSFLLFFSDFDAWPLAADKAITDPEILAHKIIATLMILVGLGTNLIRKREGVDIANLQAHLTAILAFVGGGILFTHVPTGAPYSEAAIGLHLHHFFLGLLALLVGAIKLLELSLPPRTKVWNSIWLFLLFLIAGLLIGYSEGVPWFLK